MGLMKMGVEELTIIGLVVATLASSAAAGQFALLRHQTRHSANMAIATLYQEMSRQFIDFDKYFAAQPWLHPYFYSNRDIPKYESSRITVMMTAEMVCDLAELCFETNRLLRDLKTGLDNYFFSMYATSPAVRKVLADQEEYYPARLVKAFREGGHAIVPDHPTATSRFGSRSWRSSRRLYTHLGRHGA